MLGLVASWYIGLQLNLHRLLPKDYIPVFLEYPGQLIGLGVPEKYRVIPWQKIAAAHPGFGLALKTAFWSAFALGLPFALYLAKETMLRWPYQKHLRGRFLSTSAKDAQKEVEGELGAKGVKIHPEIQIGSDRETKHMLILGGVGAGKTQILWPLN